MKMQIIVIKYVQNTLLCIAFFFSDKINCDKMLLDERIDHKIYERSACAARCLEAYTNVTLENCYQRCEEYVTIDLNIKQIYENLNIKLICRGDTNFVLEIVDSEYEKKKNVVENDTVVYRRPKLYIFKISEADPFLKSREIYVTDSRIIEIQNLTASKLYNISAVVVHANNEFSVIAKRVQFSTLEKFYKPDKIFDISISKYYESDHDRTLLSAIITWKPANDMACFYEILYYATATSSAFGLIQAEVSAPKTLYSYRLENLTFETKYQIGIRGKNPKETSKESDIFWYNFKTPTCLEWYNYNLTICPPPVPRDLNVTEKYIDINTFSINVTWRKPSLEPDYYLIKILDVSKLHLDDLKPLILNISKDQNSVLVPAVTIYGIQYEVTLQAFTSGGNSSEIVTGTLGRHIELQEYRHLRLVIIIVATIFSVAFISVVIMIACQRRAKFIRYQERCRYFEDLDKKAPADSNSNFNFSSKAFSVLPSVDQLSQLQNELEEKLFINDEMEVSRSEVQLFEVLGEGAFGLVKRGILKVDKNTKIEVAVKMLKDHPSSDDITAFRREIDVMKAVGKHPNIVSIVGHCTRNVKDFLLLTEFCSLGNLLNFLRSEWKYLNKIVQPTNSHPSKVASPRASEKQGENIFNFDTPLVEKTSLQYKNINDNKNNLSKRSESSETLNNKPPTNLVINKSYDLNGTCTSACKCQVDIISNKCLKSDDLNPEMNATQAVKIRNCECNAHTECDESAETLLIENEGYYKLLAKDEQNRLNTTSPVERQPLKTIDLLHIAKQIAMGMEFLSKNKVVHRDLAARNILVCKDRTVKIADFGLSRDIYQENIYKKTGTGKLPIKWLALESMTHQVYTTQSDVWSYGILLYEIVTLGGTPYPLIPTNRLLKLLKTGYRMEKPKNCGQELYNLMICCWHANANERPNFTNICKTLDDFMTIPSNETIINLNFAEQNKGTRSWSEESYLKPI